VVHCGSSDAPARGSVTEHEREADEEAVDEVVDEVAHLMREAINED
jgi:hypothetical protein